MINSQTRWAGHFFINILYLLEYDVLHISESQMTENKEDKI